jgi:phage baseplate assembly protein W
VRRRNAAEVDRVLTLLGRDLALDIPGPAGYWEDGDLRVTLPDLRQLPVSTDLAVAERLDAADQLLTLRLKTTKGELAPLGHPEYGSRHHELVGQPNVERTRNLIKLYVLEALSHEPRIESIVSCTVTADHVPPRDVVRIDMTVRLRGEAVPLNLVVPFSLGIVA